MKQTATPFKAGKYIALLAFFVLLFSTQKSHASHAAGADITYKWLGGLTYQVTATLYRDCSGIAAPTSIALDYHSNACGAYDVMTTLFPLAGTGNEITFPCPGNPTTCNNGI